MILEAVGRNADDLDVALCKVVCTTSDLAELSGAYRGEVSRMREEDDLEGCSDQDGKNEEEHTQESPIHSWNLIGPAVVSAWKSGAMLPRRRAGMIINDIQRREQGVIRSAPPFYTGSVLMINDGVFASHESEGDNKSIAMIA